jgi:hypothetical protein
MLLGFEPCLNRQNGASVCTLNHAFTLEPPRINSNNTRESVGKRKYYLSTHPMETIKITTDIPYSESEIPVSNR